MATGDAIPDLTWLYAIMFVGIPAFFGGGLQVVYDWNYGSLLSKEQRGPPGDEPPKLKRPFLIDLLAGGFFGLGGGAAVVLAAISLNKFSMKSNDENILYLIVLGVVAGFVGYRILPRVAQGLEDRIRTTEQDSRRALEDAMKALDNAENARTSAENAMKLAIAAQAETAEIAKTNADNAMKGAIIAQELTLAIALIGRGDYRKAEKTLLTLRKKDGLSAVIAFNLSNTYKRIKDYDSAIKLMSEYIKDLRDANMETEAAYFRALYNRACYMTLKAFSLGRDDVLVASALDDLKRAVDLDPELKEYAWEEDDFKMLRNERIPRFAEIVGREYPALTESGTA